jgi:hypothetical protein
MEVSARAILLADIAQRTLDHPVGAGAGSPPVFVGSIGSSPLASKIVPGQDAQTEPSIRKNSFFPAPKHVSQVAWSEVDGSSSGL